MSKKLNTDQKTAVQASEVCTRCLLVFPVNDDVTIRILENDRMESLTIDGIDYLGAMVKRSDIQTNNNNEVEKINITLSNVAREFSSAVANEGDNITNQLCEIYEAIYDKSMTAIIGTPILLFSGKINNLVLNASNCQFSVERSAGGYSTVSPNSTYDVSCQVKKFKDIRCGYTGSETTCDKTLSRCLALNNSLNFYGFPTIPQEMVVRS